MTLCFKLQMLLQDLLRGDAVYKRREALNNDNVFYAHLWNSIAECYFFFRLIYAAGVAK
jgi:hypothetical protein